jgi:hypothetical protein
MAAGAEGRIFHDLRRTAIRNMIRGGTPESVALSISGHRTRAVFDRYDVSSTKDRRDALRRTEAYVQSLRDATGQAAGGDLTWRLLITRTTPATLRASLCASALT